MQGEISEDNKKILNGVPCYVPFQNQVKPEEKTKVNQCVELLKNYQGQLTNQLTEMQNKVKALEQEINKSYAIGDMQKKPFHLHSICVHDGNANSGHYYTFIYDRYQKIWRKFNDIRVTECTEEDVFKEAEGGNSWMTAYWLVYVQDSIK